MSIIIRDGTNSAQLATVDSNGDLHVFTDGGTVTINGSRANANLGTFSVQSTSSSPSTLIAAGATGVFNDIITLVLTNEGTATIVSISDGTTTYKYALGANAGLNINFPSTLPATSSATAWTISNSASQTVDASGVYLKD
jgi:hypothetical protein